MSTYRLRAFTYSIPADGSRVLLFNSVSGRKAAVPGAVLERLLKEGCASGDKGERFVFDNFLIAEEAYRDDLKQVSTAKISHAINKAERLSLYIVTTRQCSFRCPYCSMEDNIHEAGGYVKKETLRDMIAWINRRLAGHNYKHVEISLYGGEPFYDIDALAGLMQELNAGVKAPIIFYGPTNGYNLDKQIVRRLKALGLRQIMVTLDGPPDVHDKRRILAGSSEGTFSRLLQNIKDVCEELPVCVRVNIDTQNIGRLDELFSILRAEGLAGKVFIDADPVEPGCSDNEHYGNFSLKEDQLNDLADAWEMIYKKGFRMAKKIPFVSPCSYYSAQDFTLDLDGTVYPCPGMIGYPAQACGTVKDEALAVKSVPQVWEKCVGCENIFSCSGGCRAVSLAVTGGLEHRVCRKKTLAGVIGRYFTLQQRYDDKFPLPPPSEGK